MNYYKILAITSSFYYFYSKLIFLYTESSLIAFYWSIFLLYMIIGSNCNIKIVYYIHFKNYMMLDLNKEISLYNYMRYVYIIKNIFICLFLAL